MTRTCMAPNVGYQLIIKLAFCSALTAISLLWSIATRAEVVPKLLSPQVIEDSHDIFGDKSARTSAETKLDSNLLFAMRAVERTKAFGVSRPSIPAFIQEFIDKNVGADGTIFVVIKASVSSDLLGALRALGARDISDFPKYETVTAVVSIGAVIAIADRSDVRFVGPREEATTNRYVPTPDEREKWRKPMFLPIPKVGAVTWEGVVAHMADRAHSTGITGVGVIVCVLSDGTDSVPSRIASGDLPASIVALAGQQGVGDEGTAMLEIVYDMAPGASLVFATGYPSAAQFATNIENLRSQLACDIIVDDLSYFNEGAFQDGPIAQAANTVTAAGAVYFSSSANSGNLTHGTSGTFEGDFVPSAAPAPAAIIALEGRPVLLHSFGENAYATLTKATSTVTLKWSDPLGGSANDYDLFVMDSAGTSILGSPGISAQTGLQDAYEISRCTGTGCSFPVGSRIYVAQYSGSTRALRLDTHRGAILNGTAGSTYGHNAAASALAVGAVNVHTASDGVFVGGSINPVENFSSDGPRRIFYYPSGVAITPGNILFRTNGGLTLAKVDLAAADCGSTKFPTLPFMPFCGTSAAAPTAAAIGALIKSARPSISKTDLIRAMLNSALDIEAPGPDRDSGVGIVMAAAGVRAVLLPLVVAKSFVPTVTAPGGNSVLTIQITNPNAVALQGIALTDVYPIPIVNSATPNPTISGTGCTAYGTALSGGPNFLISTASIPGGATCTLRVSVTSNSTGAYVDTSGAVTTPISLDTAAPSATLNVGSIPGAPTLISVVAGNAQVTVNFSPPASNGGLPITN
ncbi:MAG TPA: S8 family serine peptidase, partial [Bryobacteraceae bacterium]|nr:S8 family serine peptidase [Bryobacteraceae bacterium]